MTVRNFGNDKTVFKDDMYLANVMAQLFFINIKVGDVFTSDNKTISVEKIVAEKSIYLSVDGKRKTIWWIAGSFIGHKGTNYDWFDNVFRNVEGAIVVDLLNENNKFHKNSIFTTIAKRDRIYATEQRKIT